MKKLIPLSLLLACSLCHAQFGGGGSEAHGSPDPAYLVCMDQNGEWENRLRLCRIGEAWIDANSLKLTLALENGPSDRGNTELAEVLER